MKKAHKIIIFSSVLILVIVLISINIYQTQINKAEETMAEFEADYEISKELYTDSKQVFEVLEQAHSEQRKITVEEKRLINEYDIKYDRDSVELTHAETMIVLQLLLMSMHTETTSQLESEQNAYEEYKNDLLEYVEF